MTTKSAGKTIKLAPLEGCKVIDIVNLNSALIGIKNSGLKSQTFLKYLDFKNEIDDVIQKRDKAIKTLMEGYKIKQVYNPLVNQMNWDYQKHPDKKQIDEKVEAINTEPYALKTSNFIPDQEFFEVTKNLHMNSIAFASKYVKSTSKKEE